MNIWIPIWIDHLIMDLLAFIGFISVITRSIQFALWINKKWNQIKNRGRA